MAMIKKLIIFDDANAAGEVRAYLGKGDTSAVAFSLKGKYLLERKGVVCNTPDELVELPDFNNIGEENILRVKKVCALIDARMKEHIDYFKENGLAAASSAYYSIKIFFDAVYSTYEILERLLRLSGMERVIVIKPRLSPGDLLRNSSHVVSYLCDGVFSLTNPRITVVSLPTKTRWHIKPFLKGMIRRGNAYISSIRGSIGRRSRRETALILHDTHDIPYLRHSLLKEMNFLYLTENERLARPMPCENTAEQVRNLFESLRNDIEYRGIFGEHEQLFKFINSHLESYFCDMLSRLVPQGKAMKQRLYRAAPKFLLTSHCRLDLSDAFLLETARSCNIPVIVYQEGGGAGYLRWPLFNLDTLLSDHFMVYGEGVGESDLILNKTKIVPVGSLRLTGIKKSLKSNDSRSATIYLVLDILKTDSHQHYPFNGGFFSQAYAHQVRIIKLLQGLNANFVIKTVPDKRFLYESFSSDRISIGTAPLASLLGSAAAFILDAPATALQECLMTDRPVALLYDRLGCDFDPVSLKSLQRRVRVCSEPEKFNETIDKILRDVQREDDMQKDSDFVNRFCMLPDTDRRLRDFFAQRGYVS
jgi:hypothetical protein